ncbi:KxYKxGKxW signal peptide domain-containing protein [Enterococcus sp. AZ126]|uniref:KxYKxGKxW signal peptide domain-containing protein n=1 Tax=Enterococcus sp. AZ126 TaxID=2774635 RepID=UPI003F22A46D
MKSNKNFRKDDLSPESNTKKIYKMYKRKKQWVVAPVVVLMSLNALTPMAAFAVTDTEQADVETAQMRVVDDELQKLIIQAITSIGELTSLTTEEKAPYIEAVNKAENKIQLNDALVKVYQADIAKEVSKLSEGYTKQIDAFSFLEETEKTDFKGEITLALGLTRLESAFNTDLHNNPEKYGQAKAAFKSALEANKAEADKVVATAKAKNDARADFPKYKDEQKAIIQGMKYISDIEKANYIAKITDAKSTQDVQRVMDAATSADQEILAELVSDKITKINNKLDTSSLLDPIKATFNRRIEIIDSKIQKTDEDLVTLATIDSEVDKAIDDQKVADLDGLKIEVKTLISSEAGTIVTAADVKRFHNKVDSAKTEEAVKAVKKDWKQFLEVEKIKQLDLAAARNEAKSAIDALGFESNMTAPNYARHIDLSNTAEEIAKILAEAQAARKKEIANLIVAKEAAVKAIQALTNLLQTEKDQLIASINDATNSKTVKAKLADAKTADQSKKVQNEKDNATKKIKALAALDSSEINGYIVRIHSANTTTVEQIEAIVSEAIYENDLKKIQVADLESAQSIAKEALKDLADLTPAQTNSALKSINNAKTPNDVKKALKVAYELNESNKQVKEDAAKLTKAKDEAKEKIDAMNYLSASAKERYKAEINAQTSISDIEVIEGKAKEADDAIRDAQTQIQSEKVALVNAINGANELTLTEKKQFSDQVYKCTTENEINIIESKVKQLINDRKVADAKNPADKKAAIRVAIDGLEGLTDSQKGDYKSELNELTEKEDMVALYESAKAEAIKIYDKKLTNEIDSLIASGSYVQAQEKINQLKSDSTRKQYQEKLNDSIALSEAKADANKQIDALENMTAEEKTAAKEKISKLTTKAAVEKEAKALVKADDLIHDQPLIELAEAQINGKEFDKAAKTIDKIRDADTKAKLQKQLENAQKVVPAVKGTAHVSKIGWQPTVSTDEIIGTVGRKLALEGIKLNLEDLNVLTSVKGIDGGIQYRAHVSKFGWQDYQANGALAGTTGRSLQMEAIQIKLTGELAKRYDVEYRAHSKSEGWSKYVSNGATAGTTGKSLRMEAVQIRLVEKK